MQQTNKISLKKINYAFLVMRKGESGLTVFRLLHKDNRWLWVTASAKLVFRDGRPDFIIATQRPIL